MKCPLLIIATPTETNELPPNHTDCLKEDCAWWVNSMVTLPDNEVVDLGDCAIVRMSR